MPDPLPKPHEPDPDLDDLFRRLRGHIRRRRKRHEASGSNLVDYDRLLGALKHLRTECAKRHLSDEEKQMITVFIELLADDDLR